MFNPTAHCHSRKGSPQLDWRSTSSIEKIGQPAATLVFISSPHLDLDLPQVGYGDVSPVTGFGKVLGCFCAIFGVLVIIRSIPVINIITINFLVTIPSIAIIRWSGCPSPSSATASPSSTRGRSVGRRTMAPTWRESRRACSHCNSVRRRVFSQPGGSELEMKYNFLSLIGFLFEVIVNSS